MIGRIPILDVQPAPDQGRRPAKAVAGETFEVSATVFREGHEVLGAGVVLRAPDGSQLPLAMMRELAPGTDRYGAEVTIPAEGRWQFRVEAWGDPMAGWQHDAAIKIPLGQDVDLMLAEGAMLFDRAAKAAKAPRRERDLLAAVAAALRDGDRLADGPADRGQQPGGAGDHGRLAAAQLTHQDPVVPGGRAPAPGPVRGVVRVLPPVGGRRAGRPGRAAVRHAEVRGGPPGRHRGDGLRRGVPAAGAPDRDDRPQGPRTTR